MDFKELPLHEKVQAGIDAAGFQTCTEVQEKTFRETLSKHDVLVQSQTGTGKTAAFLISTFQLLLEDEQLKGKKAIVIAPTRELAVQIEEEARVLGQFLPFSIASFYGGVGYGKQEQAVREGVDLIIGTPGRLMDFNQSGKLRFDDIGIVVIDEADRLFDMGFLPDLRKMMKRMPPRDQRMTMLFSATLSTRVSILAWDYMNSPVEIAITPEKMTVEEITQELYHVTKTEKMDLLLGILERENPSSAIVFTNTKHAAVEVSKRLEYNGYHSRFIIGDLPQKKRLSIIESIKSGKLRILVATDVAARGLHIDDLELVINYDLPEDSENYVHRIGRTARAGKTGKAISLACERFVYSLEPIEELIDMKIPVVWADEKLYIEDKSKGMESMKRAYRELTSSRSGNSTRGKREYAGKGGKPGQSRSGRRRGAPASKPEHAGSAAHGDTRKPDRVRKERPVRQQPERAHEGRKERKPQEAARTAQSRKPVRDPKQETANRPSAKKNRKNQPGGSRKTPPIKDRVEYYRQKYGEDFRIVHTQEETPSTRKGFLDKVKDFFKGRK